MLYKDKCENILPSIPDNSIDLILTDPPYNIDYQEWDKFLNIEFITSEWYRILKDSGSIFCFAGWSFVNELIKRFDNKLILNDWIIYDRVKGRGTKKRLISTREDILWYVKSDTWIFNKDEAYSTIKKVTKGMGTKNGRDTRALSNVWTDISPIVPWSKERENHPTQKPIAISDRIIKVFSNEGNTVLDCYAGSGTFLESAKKLNRKYIGIEEKEEYFYIIQNRLNKGE